MTHIVYHMSHRILNQLEMADHLQRKASNSNDSSEIGNETSHKNLHSAPHIKFQPNDENVTNGTRHITKIEDIDEEPPFSCIIPTRSSLDVPRGSVVSFHNIQYSIKISSGPIWKCKVVEKQILQNVNGIMRPGLNAILGPTGSGKTSLLDVLAARKDPYGLFGEVLIDGAPQPKNFKCISGYVTQNDVVMGTLTVKENLLFSAALRLPNSISFMDKEERVNHIIEELGLTKVINSKVGTEFIRGVSGGERRRTSIGMELITEPPVLFLDEPTTGLDASTANAVLTLLKRLSNRERTIIFSIHQPRYSIFKLFDSLTLLANGKVLYHGQSAEAQEYFASLGYECESFNNPADFFLDIINGDSTAVAASKQHNGKADQGDEKTHEREEPEQQEESTVDRLSKEYLNSRQYQDVTEKLKMIEDKRGNKKKRTNLQQITYTTLFCTQLYWVTMRSIKNLIRNPRASVVQAFISLFLGLILDIIFFGIKLDSSGIQNRAGSLFYMSTNLCFSSVPAIEFFIKDKKLFTHQYTSGYYRVSAYFLAFLLGNLIPMRTISPVIFSCITYWMIGFQRLPGNFFFFVLTLILISYSTTSMGLAVSVGMDAMGTAGLILQNSLVVMLLFGGLLVNIPSIQAWLNWLKYFSIIRYGATALWVNEFRGLYFCGEKPNNTSFLQEMGNCSCGSSSSGDTCFGEDYLYSQGIGSDDWALWENIVALGCMTIIFVTIAYLKLKFTRRYT
ncbi:broad substrate specificity ATP-binding cassette transporter ABCG2-like [Latimeria chalumnae]|uniref:broad substrate specificity ATP-binding cassette transporter ABCG2-like n=1 Tax=Latimeria chalumnae TaxID=7897 RepID=UPI00313ED971